jgi:hypothetical protein
MHEGVHAFLLCLCLCLCLSLPHLVRTVMRGTPRFLAVFHWFQALPAVVAAQLQTACEVVALSASGRVGERWFHMFGVVGVCWVCSMLVAALISSYVASFLLFLGTGRSRGSPYTHVSSSQSSQSDVSAVSKLQMCTVLCRDRCRSAGRSRIYESLFSLPKSLRLERGPG